jgi:hypothetical protein
MKWTGHLASTGEDSNKQKVVVFRPRGRESLRPRYRWEDNKKLKETAWKGVDCGHLAKERPQWGTAMNIRVLYNVRNFLNI